MTVLLVDAAFVVDVLLGTPAGRTERSRLRRAAAHTVAHLDAEVFSALARLARAGELTPDDVERRLDRLAELDLIRLPITRELLTAAWRLRHTIAARDALYVAAAAALGAELVTTDLRLARSASDLGITAPDR